MKEKMQSVLRGASTLWVIAVFTVGVFYIDNYYFNLLEAKALFCEMAALLFIGVSLFAALLILAERSEEQVVGRSAHGAMKQPVDQASHGSVSHILQRKNTAPLDLAVFCFLLAAILSNLVTKHPREAFWGSYGWSVGTLWVVMMCLVYFFVSRNVVLERFALALIGIAAGLQFVLVIANGFLIDPFDLHLGLAAKDYPRYVGTIGNTNWYVGYVTMMVPFFLMGAARGKSAWEKIFCRTLLFLASMTCILINSQGVYLGVGAVLVVYLYLGMGNRESLRMAMLNLMVMCLGVASVSIGKRFLPSVELDGLNPVMIRPVVWGAVLVLLTVLYLILVKVKDERYLKLSVGMKRFYVAVVLVLALGLIASQVNAFDDSWGTNRGKTWRVAVQAFSAMPLLNKLFGGGTNCFGYYYLAQTGSDWVRNAHNEYLEYLVTTGVFGVLSYVGIYAGTIFLVRDKVKHASGGKHVTRAMSGVTADNRICFGVTCDVYAALGLPEACLLAILGYAAQALVNNPQALNGAMFFTILAIYRRTMEKMVE